MLLRWLIKTITGMYVSIDDIKEKKYDLKATNENAPDTSDKRTPDELMAIFKDSQSQIEYCLKVLRDETDQRSA